MTANAIFISGLGFGVCAYMFWGFRVLPAERWQMLAAVPTTKLDDEHWRGLNLTYYGLFQANANTGGALLYLLLAASAGVPLLWSTIFLTVLLCICAPCARVVAAVIEGKHNTFTIAGAASVGMVLLPGLAVAVERVALSRSESAPAAVLMTSAVLGYALGEGLGRLGCISFGCCYGKTLQTSGPLTRALFRRLNFVFRGDTKKIAYESGCAGQPVIPVQAITALLHLVVVIAALIAFYSGQFRLALVTTLLTTQVWRVVSEFWRADHRGGGKISAYQWMCLGAAGWLSGAALLLPSAPAVAQIQAGLSILRHSSIVIALELLWLAIFLFLGRSRVTASRLRFHIQMDQI